MGDTLLVHLEALPGEFHFTISGPETSNRLSVVHYCDALQGGTPVGFLRGIIFRNASVRGYKVHYRGQ